ncbi:Uncharacterised protein [Mycobacteroides abscessus subsp. abscessus]|nr:Uncharacterised protein [Mycobacteroides abscessus subsp. abscessus]
MYGSTVWPRDSSNSAAEFTACRVGLSVAGVKGESMHRPMRSRRWTGRSTCPIGVNFGLR